MIKKKQAFEQPQTSFGIGFISFTVSIPSPRQFGAYSFGLQVVNEHIYIIYNDNIANLDATNQKTNRAGDVKVKAFNPRGKAASVLATITPDGKMKREELMQRKDKMGIISPREIMSVEDENVLIGQALSGGSRIRLVRVHLK